MERITQFRGDPFGAFIHNQHQDGSLSSAECAAVFGRLIVNAAMEDDLTERLALRWGTHAGHFGRLALIEQETADFATRYFENSVSMVMTAAFGGGR